MWAVSGPAAEDYRALGAKRAWEATKEPIDDEFQNSRIDGFENGLGAPKAPGARLGGRQWMGCRCVCRAMRASFGSRACIGAILAVALFLALPAGSALAVAVVPPGNSAVNQYTETLSGPEGNVPSSEVKQGAAPAKVLGRSNARRLEALGPEGQAAAQLAADTAPHRVGKPGSKGNASHGAGSQALPGGSSGLGEVLRQMTGTSGSGGMGTLLPLVIVLALVGSIGYALGRRRRTLQG